MEPEPGTAKAEIAKLPRPYSKAYECFVQNDDDIVGLLAYALFKGSVREDAMRDALTGNSRDPSPSMVSHLRRTANMKLRELVDLNLNEARSELQLSAATEAVENAKIAFDAKIGETRDNLREHVTARTSFGSALLINIVAWMVTLFLTILILLVTSASDPAKRIVRTAHDTANALEGPSASR